MKMSNSRLQDAEELNEQSNNNLHNLQTRLASKPKLENNVYFSQRLSNAFDEVKDSITLHESFKKHDQICKYKRFKRPYLNCPYTGNKIKLYATKTAKNQKVKRSREPRRTNSSSSTDKRDAHLSLDGALSSSSDEDEEKQKKDDPDFQLEELKFNGKRNKKKRKRRNKKKSNLQHYESNEYVPTNSDPLDIYQSSSEDDSENQNCWVNELKEMDTGMEKFDKKSLIVIRGNHKKLSSKTLSDIKKMKRSLPDLIREIIIIPRCIHGQMYIINGLHNSLHFSLGEKGCNIMCDVMQELGVKVLRRNSNINIQDGINLARDHGFFVENVKQHYKSPIQKEYIMLMKDMGVNLWDILLGVSRTLAITISCTYRGLYISILLIKPFVY